MEELTERQLEVAEGIANGLSTAEIAGALGISVRTVRMHTDHIRIKWGLAHKRQIPSAFFQLVNKDA